jgi:hypothetical protein
MEDLWLRFMENMIDRVSGPMKLRLLIQPIMAAFFAVRAGMMDAKLGKPPYFWGIFTNSAERADMIKDGWKGIGKVFIMALVMDVVYQIIVERFVYPGEAIAVALMLAIVPYLLLRGLANRIARKI